MRLALTFAAALCALTVAGSARATPASRLVYSRSSDASSCPDEEALRKAVAARVGYDPFFPYAARTIVTSVVRRHESFVATVDLVDENGMSHGARELRARSDCSALLDAVALAIAIAIDPQSLVRQSSPPAPRPPPPEPPPKPSPVPVPVVETSPVEDEPRPAAALTTKPSLAFEPSIGILALLGTAPKATAGVTVGAGARWGRFSLAIEGVIDAPAGTTDSRGGSASSWLAYGAVVPCVHVGVLFGCGVVQGGGLRAAGDAEANTRSTWLPWWAAGGRVGIEVPLGERTALRFRADLVADLKQPSFELNSHTVWNAPPVAGSTGADLVFHFP